MNIQRFTAATSREALSKARMAFGDSTLILSNRPTENGVEVVATAEETLAALDQADSKIATAKSSGNAALSYRETAGKVEDDANQLAMSTLSFQDYVRERMMRRRNEATGDAATTKLTQNAPASAARQPGPIRIKPDVVPVRDRKSTRLNSSHVLRSRMPSSA